MKSSFSIPISRRDFMKLAGITAAGVISGTSDMPKAAAAAPKIPGVDFSEADVSVLYDMALIGAIKDEDRITECVVQTVEGLGKIQPTCMSMGEAAGIAVAWGLSHNIEANAIRWENIPKEQRSYSSNG